jgi:hypothetical protein
MAWNAPMTAVAGSVFSAAQFNTFVRDNLNESAPAKATTLGSLFVTSGTNQISERTPADATVATEESTASTSYVNLATIGPSVTVTTGTGAFVALYSQIKNSSSGLSTWTAFNVSGSTTVAEDDTKALQFQAAAANGTGRFGGLFRVTGLTPGSNTFTQTYRVSGGTGFFAARRILVIPL